MDHHEFLKRLTNPVPAATLKKWPAGQITQYWAENPDKYAKAFGHTDDLHRFTGGHSGIDIVGPHRTPVVAAHEGYVHDLRTERAGLGGLVIWLRSPELDLGGHKSNIVTAYGHLDEILVKYGQWVNKGEPLGRIGYMGNTGFVISGGTPYWGNAPAGVGTHCHFSLYEYVIKNGAMVPRWFNAMQNSTDPLPYLMGNEGLGGLQVALYNMKRYLDYLRGQRA